MLTTVNLLFILSGLALILGVMGLLIGIYSVITVKAMEKSTHAVQYIPVDPQIDKENQAFMKEGQDEWGTSESAIAKQNKYWAKDLEENMPDFAPSEEDKKRFSY